MTGQLDDHNRETFLSLVLSLFRSERAREVVREREKIKPPPFSIPPRKERKIPKTETDRKSKCNKPVSPSFAEFITPWKLRIGWSYLLRLHCSGFRVQSAKPSTARASPADLALSFPTLPACLALLYLDLYGVPLSSSVSLFSRSQRALRLQYDRRRTRSSRLRSPALRPSSGSGSHSLTPRLLVVACTSSHSPALFQPNRIPGTNRSVLQPELAKLLRECVCLLQSVSDLDRGELGSIHPSHPQAFNTLYATRRYSVAPVPDVLYIVPTTPS